MQCPPKQGQQCAAYLRTHSLVGNGDLVGESDPSHFGPSFVKYVSPENVTSSPERLCTFFFFFMVLFFLMGQLILQSVLLSEKHGSKTV